MRRPVSRLGLPALSVVVALTASAVPATHGATVPGTPSAAAHPVVLDRPAHGDRAVRLLGDRLDDTAARNGMTRSTLTELLTTDPSAWVDTAGAVFFKEEPAPAPAQDPVSAAAPLDQTFRLHSNPGTTRTIYLDFDGGNAAATGWHASYPTTPTTQPAWDPAGNGAAFTDSELTSIQTIWQAVAEDYAPFDVDVTTADPGPAGIHRSSLIDPAYGSHVMITPSVAAQEAICPSGCGGVAYIGVFDVVNGGGRGAGADGYGYLQPAWVFPQRLGNSPKNIAEAATHEVGHNFGLRHDGNATQGYDRGHGAWAPIMGVGYDHPISQWSKGDYAGATNLEDDVAIIRGVAGPRLDEAPSTVLAAPPVPTGAAYVTSRTDVDTYALGACGGAVTVTASPLASAADLDVGLTVRNDLGQVVATADPASGQVSPSVASGMGAAVSLSLPTGVYYASVDGVGNGPWSSGYDDYGSMGAYTLAATGCDDDQPTATLVDLVASANGRTVTLTASPTTTSGPLVGDVVFRDGTTVVGTTRLGLAPPTLTLTSVTPGTHAYTATFVPLGLTHLGSTSPVRTVTIAADPVAAPTPTPTTPPTTSATTSPARVSASTTTITAPRRARAGTRPTVTVTVARSTGPATGTVVITVGTRSRTVTLRFGSAELRLRRVTSGRVRISVRYAGDATTSASTARRMIRVRA